MTKDPYHYGPAAIVDIRSRRMDPPPRDYVAESLAARDCRIAELTQQIDRWQTACLCAVLVIVVLFAMLIW